MPHGVHPRHGSMAIWPRVRAKSQVARIRYWPSIQDTKLIGFAGYKVGMTHIMFTDARKNSLTKGEDVNFPATVIECPPVKIAGIRFYKLTPSGLQVATEIWSSKNDKELGRTVSLPKKSNEAKLNEIKAEDYKDIRVLVYTQPRLVGFGKKKPELFEMAIGGKTLQDKINYAKEKLGKEIAITEIFKEGQQLDAHCISIGKGFQGPVKRFGVHVRQHKSEKTKRGPGSLGPWHPHRGNYRVAHAGWMGYHQRVERNLWLLKIGSNPAEINPKGAFINYGLVKNTYILIKGSIPGPEKRFIQLIPAIRPDHRVPDQAPEINYVSLESRQ